MADDYISRSSLDRPREEKKEEEKEELKPIATGKQIAKSGMRKKLDSWFVRDIRDVADHVWREKFLPSLISSVETLVESLLLGDEVAKKRSTSERVSYRSYYDSRDRDRDRDRYSYQRDRYEFAEVYLDSRSEAEAILDRMDEICRDRGFVSVAVMCELADVPTRFTDNNWGWDSLRSARIVDTRNGYLLDMPRAIEKPRR